MISSRDQWYADCLENFHVVRLIARQIKAAYKCVCMMDAVSTK